MLEILKPLALALASPVALILSAFGFTADEQTVQNVLLALATILGVIGAYWGPSFKAFQKFGRDAK